MTVRAEVHAEIPSRAAPYETPPSGSNPTDSCTARNDAAPEGGAAVHVQAPPDETVALHDGTVDALRCTCTRKPGVSRSGEAHSTVGVDERARERGGCGDADVVVHPGALEAVHDLRVVEVPDPGSEALEHALQLGVSGRHGRARWPVPLLFAALAALAGYAAALVDEVVVVAFAVGLGRVELDHELGIGLADRRDRDRRRSEFVVEHGRRQLDVAADLVIVGLAGRDAEEVGSRTPGSTRSRSTGHRRSRAGRPCTPTTLRESRPTSRTRRSSHRRRSESTGSTRPRPRQSRQPAPRPPG